MNDTDGQLKGIIVLCCEIFDYKKTKKIDSANIIIIQYQWRLCIVQQSGKNAAAEVINLPWIRFLVQTTYVKLHIAVVLLANEYSKNLSRNNNRIYFLQ